MSNLIRWEPAREMMTLREAMDHLINDAFTRPLNLNGGNWSIPAVDMYQTDNEVVVKAALPGIKAEEVQISVTGETLTIKGEVKQEQELEKKERSYHLHEQLWGMFERSLSLPVEVIADKARADFENGVLTVTLPKAEKVKPKSITIKTK